MSHSTSSTISIQASAEEVLETLCDVESYSSWAKGIDSVEIEREDEQGRVEVVTVVIDAGVLRDECDVLYNWEEIDEVPHKVSWSLQHGSAITALDGAYILTPQGDDETDVTYELSVDVSMPVPSFMKKKAEQSIVKSALNGLKDYVESK